MRIDSYLWCIRFYKTRSIATKACKKGAVKVNDLTVKPSRHVFQGDILKLRKQQIHYVIQVLDLPKCRLGAKLLDLYRKDLTPKEAFDHVELLKYAKDYYRKKGTGRPTKKDRRNITDFTSKSLEEE
ncbi:MAG: RNA-binding S4 domain-containing protein [Flavobacteriales bacterium]